MKTPDLRLTIPAEIAALPRLTIAEKVALAHIAEHPNCSHAVLAELLGLSPRGIEEMLRRLRGSGHITRFRKGRARCHYLTLHVEHHENCGSIPQLDPGKTITT